MTGQRAPAADRPLPAADEARSGNGHALRRLLGLWLAVAAIEAVLYVFLYRSPELKGLYELPAVAVLVAGLIQGWHSRRRRLGHDRRRADRRQRAG